MNGNVFPTLKSEGHNYAVNGKNAKGNHPPQYYAGSFLAHALLLVADVLNNKFAKI
jgi:hypothetical protein